MSGKTQKKTILVYVKKTWVEQSGLDPLIEPENPLPVEANLPFRIIRAVAYSLVDGWFLEVEFSSKLLSGKSIKLLVPKQDVLAVVEGEKPEDLLGFKHS